MAFVNLPALTPLEDERETVQYFTDRLGNAYEVYFGKSSSRLQISKVSSADKIYDGVFDATSPEVQTEDVAGLFTMDRYGLSVCLGATSSTIEFELKEPNHFYGIQVNSISPDDVVVNTVSWFRDDSGTPYELVLLSNGKIAVRLAD